MGAEACRRSKLLVVAISLSCLLSCISFTLNIEQEFGGPLKVLKISEIQLFNQGSVLLPNILHVEGIGFYEPNSTKRCVDGDITSHCEVMSTDDIHFPAIRIDSAGLYFDKIIVHSHGKSTFGARLTLAQNDLVFWSYAISEHTSVHVFDIQNEAQLNFPIKIVDTFAYNGEPVAAFHVEHLFPVVNEFVIVESRYTLSGKLKDDLYFERDYIREKFTPFISKIRYVTIDEFPPRPNDWFDPEDHGWMSLPSHDAFWREHYQRAYVKRYLNQTSQTILLVVDADEVPNKDVVAKFRDETLYDMFHAKVRLEMYLFYYNFLWHSPNLWKLPFAVSVQGFFKEKEMVSARTSLGGHIQLVSPAGWHMTYFLSVNDIVRKLQSFAHVELDKPESIDMNHVRDSITRGVDLFDRKNVVFNLVDLNSSRDQLPNGWEKIHREIMCQQTVEC